jgi:ubiquinone/menaquinone biosynthesis C-methylase UbiE
MTTREKGIAEELDFWDCVMRDGGQFPEEIADRLNPDMPLQEGLRALLGARGPVRILDVGAGPFTTIGKRWDGEDVQITAVDPLADEYAALLKKHGLVAPVPTLKGEGERLHFPQGHFDLVYARNSLDHAVDPVACILEMLRVAKKFSYVVLLHVAREADLQKHTGLHQHNFYRGEHFFDGGAFMIESSGKTTNVSELVKNAASVSTRNEDGWVHVCMWKFV